MSRGHRVTRRVAELDGVRGIAVLLVLVCHAVGNSWGNVGGAGVTVFFVLSGYLITDLLLREREATGRIDLRRFYERRARRLLPALVVVVSFVVLASAFLPGDTWFTWSSLPPVALYYANWWTIADGPLGALVHTWSLAVEEQFYLVWPLLVLALGTRRRLLRVALPLLGATLVLRVSLVGPDAVPRVYFGTDTTAFALLAGVLVACIGLAERRRPWVPVVALSAVLLTTLMPPAPFVWIGMPVVAVASALAIRWARQVPWLALRGLRWFGDRSYGLYLVNLPVFIALREYTDLSPLVIAATGVVTSLVLAELSFRLVETRWHAPLTVPADRDRARQAETPVDPRGPGRRTPPLAPPVDLAPEPVPPVPTS